MENKYPKFWRKAIKGNVGGRTLNGRGDEVEFLLKGDPTNPNSDEDAMVVEIVDENAEKYFKRSNKAALNNGYLISISDHTIELDETNAVSDGYLKDLMKKPLSRVKPRIDKFTSSVPVRRLLELARAENKPVKTIAYLEGRVKALEGTSEVVSGDFDGVRIQSTN